MKEEDKDDIKKDAELGIANGGYANDVETAAKSDFCSRRVLRYFFLIFFFYSGMDASHPEILFIIHSHNSCRPSGDCGGSRNRAQKCCVAVW
jgi:hypothetical protein